MTAKEFSELRKRKGINQYKLAEMLNVSQAYISDLEQGNRGGKKGALILEQAKKILDELPDVK